MRCGVVLEVSRYSYSGPTTSAVTRDERKASIDTAPSLLTLDENRVVTPAFSMISRWNVVKRGEVLWLASCTGLDDCQLRASGYAKLTKSSMARCPTSTKLSKLFHIQFTCMPTLFLTW